jgi:hypothetical protein
MSEPDRSWQELAEMWEERAHEVEARIAEREVRMALAAAMLGEAVTADAG